MTQNEDEDRIKGNEKEQERLRQELPSSADRVASAPSSFFGLDTQRGDTKLFDTVVTSSGGALTQQMLDDAIKRIYEWEPPPPCGTEKNPHLYYRCPVGNFTICRCGLVFLHCADDTYRPQHECY